MLRIGRSKPGTSEKEGLCYAKSRFLCLSSGGGGVSTGAITQESLGAAILHGEISANMHRYAMNADLLASITWDHHACKWQGLQGESQSPCFGGFFSEKLFCNSLHITYEIVTGMLKRSRRAFSPFCADICLAKLPFMIILAKLCLY